MTPKSLLLETDDTDEKDTLVFEKRLDCSTGSFVYQLRSTNFITLDVPHGLNLLVKPSVSDNSNSIPKSSPFHKKVRGEIIKDIRREHAKKKSRDCRISNEKEKERLRCIWNDACKQNKDGHIILSGQNLGYIWHGLQNFDVIHSIPLTGLTLVEHGLETCDNVGLKCRRLKFLNLSSNNIKRLHDSIGGIASLIELNLSHNNLTSLPDSIGNLMKLQDLNLSYNSITELPPRLFEIATVRRLNVEHNRIRFIPLNIGSMTECRELELNCNALTALPNSIYRLPLEKLAINDNQLQCLPAEICELKFIKVLHASRNLLVSIPEDIGVLKTLKSLWLDYNRLCAIPHGFHHLIHLNDLRLEGNVDIVHPPMDVISLGVEAVKNWSETRLSISRKSRQRHIIIAVQDILYQVGTLGLCNQQGEKMDVSCMYREDIDLNGDRYYQFLENALFDTFIPFIMINWALMPEEVLKGLTTSFPYSREETQTALHEYEDACGKVYIHNPKGKFKNCCCVDTNGRRKCCTTTDSDWMCERPVVLLKSSLDSERSKEEKGYIRSESDRILNMTQLAKQTACIYLSSVEGRLTIRKAAKDELILRHSKDTSSKVKLEGGLKRFSSLLSFRKELAEIERALTSNFISKQMDCAREEAIIDNKKMRKAVDAWKGVFINKCFVGWLRLLRKIKRQKDQLLRAGRHSYELLHFQKDDTEENSFKTETSIHSVESVLNAPIRRLDLIDVDVRQERMMAACRIFQANKNK